MIEDKKEIEIVKKLLEDNFTSMGNPKICYDFVLGILTSCYEKTKSEIVNNVLIKLKEFNPSCPYIFDSQIHEMFLDELCFHCFKNENSATRYILINLNLYKSNTIFNLFADYVTEYYIKNNINYGYDTNLDEIYNKRSKINSFGRITLEFSLAEEGNL